MPSFLTIALLVFVNLEFSLCFDKLEMKKINQDIAYGIYTFSDQEGIIFNSTVSRVSITDLQGEPLLMISAPTKEQCLITIHTDLFIQLKTRQGYTDYYVPHRLEKELRNQLVNKTNIRLLDPLSSSYHANELRRSVESFISKRTTYYIIQSAYKLGRDLNYIGLKYPSILPFYLIAHRLEGLLLSPPESEGEKFNRVRKYGDLAKDESCFKECPPCPDRKCLSLCGFQCYCWRWICGDCCHHLGCHGHDLCCRASYMRSVCLFPIHFRCESEYNC